MALHTYATLRCCLTNHSPAFLDVATQVLGQASNARGILPNQAGCGALVGLLTHLSSTNLPIALVLPRHDIADTANTAAHPFTTSLSV